MRQFLQQRFLRPHEEVLKKLKAYSEEMKETVQKKAEKLDEIGYQAYLEK